METTLEPKTTGRLRLDYEAMLLRIRRIMAGQETIEMVDLEYWGDRFNSLNVRFYTGQRFEAYLRDPEASECATRVMKDVLERCGARPVAHTRKGALQVSLYS